MRDATMYAIFDRLLMSQVFKIWTATINTRGLDSQKLLTLPEKHFPEFEFKDRLPRTRYENCSGNHLAKYKKVSV